MKIKDFVLVGMVTGTLATGLCQESQVPASEAGKAAPPATQANLGNVAPVLTDRQIAEIARFQSETVSRILGVNMKIEGIIPQAFRVKRPLQLISPFAPAEYGNGWDNVTIDPESGRANGIKFFGVRF